MSFKKLIFTLFAASLPLDINNIGLVAMEAVFNTGILSLLC
jgi:hypothetical protein